MPTAVSALARRHSKFHASSAVAAIQTSCACSCLQTSLPAAPAAQGPTIKRLSSLAHYMMARDPNEAEEEEKVG